MNTFIKDFDPDKVSLAFKLELVRKDINNIFYFKEPEDELIYQVLTINPLFIYNIPNLNKISNRTIIFLLDNNYWYFDTLYTRHVKLIEFITYMYSRRAALKKDIAFISYVVNNTNILSKESLIDLIYFLDEHNGDYIQSVQTLDKESLKKYITFNF